MNDAEVMTKIIKWMISGVSNIEYIQKLNIMVEKLVGQKYIDEFNHPRHLSIVMLGVNLFPYKIEDYREMTEILIKKDLDK